MKSKKLVRKKLLKYIYIPILGSLFCSKAYCVDLLTVYNDAVLNYPLLKSQFYTAESYYLDVPSLRNTLFFPSIEVGASYNFFHIGSKIKSQIVQKYDFDPSSIGRYNDFSLSMTQNIFNYPLYQSLSSSSWLADSFFSSYLYQKQIFIQNLIQAYFQVIENQESLEAAQSNKDYSQKVYEFSKEQYKVGLITMNDVDQAKAPYDLSLAELIQAKNSLQLSILNLSNYTGKVYDKFSVLRDDFPFMAPEKKVKDWLNAAEKYNNNLTSSRQLLKSYAYNVSMYRGAYLPVLTLAASYKSSNYNYYNDKSFSGIDGFGFLNLNDVYQIQLDLTWNFFNGMKDFETVKQSAYNFGAQQAEAIYQLRDVDVSVGNDYLSIGSNASQVKANHQAVVAGQEALNQALAQYKVGVNVCSSDSSSSASSSASSSCSSDGTLSSSPLVNVLEKNKMLVSSQQSYVQSKYNYIASKISLALDSGTLSRKDVEVLNQWLTDNKEYSNFQSLENL